YGNIYDEPTLGERDTTPFYHFIQDNIGKLWGPDGHNIGVQAVTSIYGQTHIEKAKAEGILLNINNIKKSGYIFFDAYHDNTARGGEREYMLAVIAPMINYFQSLKLKKILIDISHRINNKKKYNKNNYWNLIVEVLLDS
ncbi:unnamed protein product, partial [marine sediment metagenome]